MTELSEKEYKSRLGFQQHETSHTTQSALIPGYEALYILNAASSAAIDLAVERRFRDEGWACYNIFEILAGLEAGGYDEC